MGNQRNTESVIFRCQSDDSHFKADAAQQTGTQPQRARPSPRKPIHNRSFQKSISQMFSEETGLGRETTHFRYQWPQGPSPHIPCSKMFDKFPSFCNYLSFHIPLCQNCAGWAKRSTEGHVCYSLYFVWLGPCLRAQVAYFISKGETWRRNCTCWLWLGEQKLDLFQGLKKW